jgi:hypothetical protein
LSPGDFIAMPLAAALQSPGAPRPQQARGRGCIIVRREGARSVLHNLFQEGSAKVRFPRTEGPGREAVLINTAGGLGPLAFVGAMLVGYGLGLPLPGAPFIERGVLASVIVQGAQPPPRRGRPWP